MMPHILLLARRSRTPAIAVIKLIGISLLLIEMIVIQISMWHPWGERGTTFRIDSSTGDLHWEDGSILGCAEAYQEFGYSGWHLDVYLDGSWWPGRVKEFDLPTKEAAINKGSEWCKK